MKEKLLLTVLLLGFIYSNAQSKISAETKQIQKTYANYEKALKKSHKKLKHYGIPPNLYNEQDYKNTMDPVTGENGFRNLVKIKADIDAGKYNPTQSLSIFPNNNKTGKIQGEMWFERGPYSVGGRTRAIMFDPNDPTGKRVFAGGVSGGLWVNQDPSVSTNEWKPLSDFWANTSISCITYDPNNTQTFYVGTGESCTGDAAGSGIWKSTDGGATWTNIFTGPTGYNGTIKNGNFYVNDIKVRNNGGVSEVYAGLSGANVSIQFSDGWLGLYQSGLYKSTDGGATFTRNASLIANNNATVPVSSGLGYSIQQIEIGADNSVWVSTRSSRFSNVDSGGRIFKATDGENFTQVYINRAVTTTVNGSRVNFALSKTNPLKAYGLLQGISGEPVRIIRTVDGGATWVATNDATPVITLPKAADTGIPANDFTRGQASYDLVIIPDPLNDNIVYAGGIDLYKSIDGAATWTQISKWSNNNNMKDLAVPVVHADQHAIVFNPFNNYSTNQMMFGNDGGIYFAPNKNNVGTSATDIVAANTRYNVTQFYGGVLNPVKTPADEEMFLGAQDNGTHYLYGAPLANNFYTSYYALSGDGMYSEYDDNGQYDIGSYVYNTHYIVNYNATTPAWNLIIKTSADRNLGHFVNEIALDRLNDNFFSYRSGLTLFRTNGVSSATQDWSNVNFTVTAAQTNEQISNLKVSPFTTTAGTTLFVGTNQGRLFRVNDADKTTFATTVLTTPGVGTISDIEFGPTENNIVVTLSNYNVVSIYYTTDGGTTWTNKEGNLPDMPVRTVFMNPDNNNEVVVGTEAGIWGTANFLAATPTWARYSNGLGTVRVTSLDYRPSTKTLLAATYGRGAWTTQNTAAIALGTSSVNSKKNIAAVYPNPSRGTFYLRFDSEKNKSVDVKVYDSAGRLVFTKGNVKADEQINARLKVGNYVLKAENNGTQVFSTFLLVKGGEVD